MKKCQHGYVWEEAGCADCYTANLNKKLQKYMDLGWYGSAKNLAEWYVRIAPAHQQGDIFPEIVIARSAWQLSDYAFAAEKMEELKDSCSPEDRAEMLGRLQEYEQMPVSGRRLGPEVTCNDARVEKTLKRLAFIFHEIKKPVAGYVIESEQDYAEYMKTYLPTEKVPYSYFKACGFYSGKDAYHVIFHKSVIDKFDDTALTGICAHELAHLELTDKNVRYWFFQPASGACKEDFHMNERLTDLYVISKGLAYPLWYCRGERKKESHTILTREDIYNMICDFDCYLRP